MGIRPHHVIYSPIAPMSLQNITPFSFTRLHVELKFEFLVGNTMPYSVDMMQGLTPPHNSLVNCQSIY